MRLDTVNNFVSTEFRKIEKTDQKSKSATYKPPRPVKKDQATLSQKGGGTDGDVKNVAARVAVEPEIRGAKISEVQEKIKNGYYNSSEFADKLADRLIKDFL